MTLCLHGDLEMRNCSKPPRLQRACTCVRPCLQACTQSSAATRTRWTDKRSVSVTSHLRHLLPLPHSPPLLPDPPRPLHFPSARRRRLTSLQPRRRPGAHISRPCCTPGSINCTVALVYRPGCLRDGNSRSRPSSPHRLVGTNSRV